MEAIVQIQSNSSPGESNIFQPPEVPWEELDGGWRRQVLFSGQLTLVILEAPGPEEGPIPLHHHVQDQISCVLEGEIEVQIGEETRRVGAGSFYRAPPNVPHGIRVLSRKARLADAFTPPREDFRQK